MKIYSMGTTIYLKSPAEKILKTLTNVRDFCHLCLSTPKPEIKHKIKKEKKGIRHIYYYEMPSKNASGKTITSYSFLEREI